jgi:succinate dehydrogenase/fumarate reductase flavoprotein subunit
VVGCDVLVVGAGAGGLSAAVTAAWHGLRVVAPFNRGSGDPDPSLAPIEQGPFYAIKVLPGSFGTFAGLTTKPQSQVLRADGTPIPSLYAVGCDQANVMGGYHPSGGINIGPAMTFGYIAGRHAAGATAYEA